MTEPIISCDWLNENIDDPNILILDASSSRNKAGIRSEFETKVLPNARVLRLDQISHQESSFPNTFPTADQFEQKCRELGIHASTRIIVYDNLGIYFSPRIWWVFKAMGHQHVSVLNGGLPEWINQGFETTETHSAPKGNGSFKGQLNQSMVKDLSFISSNIYTEKHLVVDARNEERFKAQVPEPREGLRSGHIRDSINVPYQRVLSKGKYKTKEELLEVFDQAGIDERPLTFSCGSGVTACILLLAAELVLINDTSIYDGSWTEYGTLVKED